METERGPRSSNASFDLYQLPLELLEREITQLAAHIHAATCRFLLLVGELDRREGWAEWGCKSCAHWLSWQCAIGLGAAREQVRVARCLDELPAIRAAFGRGALSFSQVRAMTRGPRPRPRRRCSRSPSTPRRRNWRHCFAVTAGCSTSS
ncbi:MAG: DUF222 domain-containing protein [Thermoleophilaceae bacterium]